MTKKFLS